MTILSECWPPAKSFIRASSAIEDTVIPEINIGLLSQHDMLFLGEKGQAKSRLMRGLIRFLDEEIPYLDIPAAPFHEDPLNPISRVAKRIRCRPRSGRHSHPVVASRRPLRRATGAGNQVRRHHR